MKATVWDYDFLIIGSGFGGSVSAYRLSEKGYKVAVLERGKRYRPEDFPKTNWNIRKYLWWPLIRCFGIQNLTFFKNVFILSGSGVGGGSLVYANTLMVPDAPFFQTGTWKGLCDWQNELEPYYARAKKMLGATVNPVQTRADLFLQTISEEMGRGDTFRPATVGVFFGNAERETPDPYFDGKGPSRTGCRFCGGCMVGCRYGAKNTLDKNYLYLAEKNGAKIFPETEVTRISPVKKFSQKEGNSQNDEIEGYSIEVVQSTAFPVLKELTRKKIHAKKIVVAAGVLGTLKLLLRAKWVDKTLPLLSQQLGRNVRTNSEALIGVHDPLLVNAPKESIAQKAQRDQRTQGVQSALSEKSADKSEIKNETAVASTDKNNTYGVAISSIFHPDEHTHIEPVRYSSGSSFMRLLAVPMVDSAMRWARPLFCILEFLKQPIRLAPMLFTRNWAEKSVILLVMQNVDNRLRFSLGRNILNFWKNDLETQREENSAPVPSVIAIGHQVARRYAQKVMGFSQSAVNEVLLSIPTTAHILGGCTMAKDVEEGVINDRHEVFNYPGLYVCDGSAIPANLGVNPSLTITAMTERAMDFIPYNSGSSSSDL